MLLLPQKHKRHSCKEMTQSQGTVSTLEYPKVGQSVSVIKHTSDFKNTHPEGVTFQNVKESCSVALVGIHSSLPQIYAGPSTSSSSDESTETRKTERSCVIITPLNSFGYHSSVTKNSTKPSYLRNLVNKSSITSQTSNVPQVNSEEAGTSASKLKAGKRADESLESAAGEHAEPFPGFQHLVEAEIARMQLHANKLLTEETTISSSSLRNTSTQETERGSAWPTMGSKSLHATQSNFKQAATSGSELVTDKFAGGPPESLEGACASSTQWNTLSKDHPQGFYCKLCRLYYTSWEALDSHIVTLIEHGTTNAMAHNHSPYYRKPGFFVCQTCQLHFDTKYDLFDHYLLHTTPTPYECTLCNMRYQSEKCLSDHESKTHAKRTIYKCQICYKRFLSDTYLKNHHCGH